MWTIPKTADRKVKRATICDRGPTVLNCSVLLMPDSLSFVWGHSVHFAKFLILRFSTHYSFNSFCQILTKLHTKYHNQGLIWVITFLSYLPKIKNLCHLKCLSTQYHMELEISKCYSCSFHPMSAKLYEDIRYQGGIQAITFLGNRRSFKNSVAP